MRLRFAPLQAPDERLGSVLTSWRGTPFVEGQCLKGVGVNCSLFVVGVLDDLDPQPISRLTKYRQAAPRSYPARIRQVMRACGPFERRPLDDLVRDGDVVAFGSSSGGEMLHLAMAYQGRLWHAQPHGRVGWMSLPGPSSIETELRRIYRLSTFT